MFSTRNAVLTAIILAASVAAAQAQTPDQDHTAHHATEQTRPMPDRGKMMGADTGQMMPMMRMMRDGMMQGGMGMVPLDHIEGRIAFYKAELGITDAQLPQWNAFADALRDGTKGMRAAMSAMIQAKTPTTAPARMEAMVQMMSARLDAMKATLAAVKSLYGVLSDDQKKTADELMAEPGMGMRAAGMGER
jgi:hypothetical protein